MSVRHLTPAEREQARGRTWYVFTVPPQKEFAAVDILNNHFGVSAFVVARAVYRRRNRYAKAKTLHEFPVAPRYVFVGADPAVPVPWYALSALHLVSGVLCTPEGYPRQLSVAEVDRLLRMHSVKALHAPIEQSWMQSGKEFSVGDEVLVSDGPFEGRRGRVDQIEGNKAHMLLEWLGGDQQFEFRLDQLEAIM